MAEYSDYISAIDNHNVANGDASWLSKKVDSITDFIGDVGEFSVKGPISAVIAGVDSILNSGIAISNAFGTDIEPISTYEVLQNLDSSLGDYYKKHSEGIEIGGFALGMFVPGTAGVKALNAAKAGFLGTNMAKSSGLMVSLTKDYASIAKAEAAAGSSPFSVLNKSTLQALAQGYGSATLEMAAFNTAVTASMFKSPVLDTKDIGDLFWDDVRDTVLFGGVGGIFKGFSLYSQVKKAGKAADELLFPYREILGVPANSEASIKILNYFESKFSLPEVVGPFQDYSKVTGLSEGEILTLATKERDITSKKIDELLRSSINEFAGGDAALGNQLFEATKQAKSFEEAAALFLNSKKLSRIGETEKLEYGDVRYLNHKLTKEDFEQVLKSGDHDQLFTVDSGKGGAEGYKITGDYSQLRVIASGKDSKLGKEVAFDQGYDIYRNLNGTFTVNPESKILQYSKDARAPNTQIIDLQTGNIVTKALPNLGDLATKENPVKVIGETVLYGKNNPIKVGKSSDFSPLPNFTNGIKRSSESKPGLNGISEPIKIETKTSSGQNIILEREFSGKYNIKSSSGEKLGSINYTSLADGSGFKVSGVDIKSGVQRKGIASAVYNVLEQEVIKGKFEQAGGQSEAGAAFRNARNSQEGNNYLDIQARYIWAQEAKVNWEGLVISENDLPLLEKLYQDEEKIKPGTSIYIDTSAGRTQAVRGETLRMYIENQKKSLAEKMSESSMSTDEIALRLNMDKSLLEGNSGDWIRIKNGYPYKDPQYAKMIMDGDTSTYPMLNPNNHTGALEYKRQVELNKERALQNFTNFAKEDADFFPDALNWGDKGRIPTREGAGATFLGFANAPILSVGSWAQAVGQQVDKLLLKRKTFTKEMHDDAVAAVRVEGVEATAETSILNNKFLQSESANPWVFHPDGSNILVKKSDYYRIAKDINYQPEEILNIKNEKVAEFWKTQIRLGNDRQTHVSNLKGAAGIADDSDPAALYGIPINTEKLKHFVMVKPLAPVSLNDKMRVIAAKDESTLAKLISQVDRNTYDVVTKADGERWHKALGDYEYSLGINQTNVDSALTREGKLSQHFPDLGEGIFDRALEYNMRQEEIVTHSMVHHRYAQNFEELGYLGERYKNVATSQFTNSITERLEKGVKDPYNDIVRTALNISRSSEYQPWVNFNNFVRDSIEKPINVLRNVFAKTEKIDEEFVNKVNEITKGMGQGMPLRTATDIMIANGNIPNKPWIQPFVAKFNALLSTTLLQWDSFNAINNTVSTAIIAAPELNRIREAIGKGSAEGVGKLSELSSVKMPDGSGIILPTTSRLLFNASQAFIKQDAITKAATQRFQDIGAIGTLAQEMRQALDQSTLNFNLATGKEAEKSLAKWTEFGRKWTGNNLAEEFTRFVSAHAASQITDIAEQAGILTTKEANELISLFTNRTQGNYLYSQRPIVFQGVVGQAIGLFQTYQFNLMQQLFKYVGEGDSKSLAILGGLQAGIYGMQGLPAFNFINTHIVGNSSGNTDHRDLYNASYTTFGKSMGDWILYGAGSNALSLVDPSMRFNLYSRGDINPRQLSVLPTQIEDIPIVAASTKFIGNIFKTFEKVADGANIFPAISQGIEHNGVSRPLAGLAQIVQGYTTSNKGSLLTGGQDFWNIATLSRLGGAKPFEEAVALDALYRINAYKAKDTKEISDLGAAIKTTVVGGGTPSSEQINKFAAEYAKQGGKVEGFNKYFSNLLLQANRSQVNSIAENMNNRFAVQVQQIMGGEKLPDFTGK